MLLLSNSVLAKEGNKPRVRAKIYSNNKTVEAKFMIKSPMIGQEYYEYYSRKHNLQEDFISHITVKYGSKIILDISTSPYVSKNPVIEHKFKDNNLSKSVEYFITDNKGRWSQSSFVIHDNKRHHHSAKTSNRTKTFLPDTIVDYKKLKPKAWGLLSVEKAIFELYGVVKNPIKNKINLSSIQHHYCEQRIPVHIKSDIDLESFAIFSDQIEKPTIAVFSISKDSLIDIKIRVKIYKVCQNHTIIVVAKDRNGNFYKTSSKGQIACGDNCGGGG